MMVKGMGLSLYMLISSPIHYPLDKIPIWNLLKALDRYPYLSTKNELSLTLFTPSFENLFIISLFNLLEREWIFSGQNNAVPFFDNE